MKQFIVFLLCWIFIVSYYQPVRESNVPHAYVKTIVEFDTLAEATRWVQLCKKLGYLQPTILKAEKV